MPDMLGCTKAFTLKYGGKNSWFDCHRRFLPPNHAFRSRKGFTKNRVETDGPPYILTGEEISDLISDLPRVVESGVSRLTRYGVSHNWTKQRIFWDLPYWKNNLLRHNLDVMHIERKNFDNVFITVMNIKGRTKITKRQEWTWPLFASAGTWNWFHRTMERWQNLKQIIAFRLKKLR